MRAFRAAGAKHVISSIWKADDTFTRDFMVQVHKSIAAGEAPTQALRNAQLESLKKDPPYRWASFIHTGDSSSLPEAQ